ncbi:MAG: ABC transporter permease, partial [Paraclostridium sp.]
LVNFLYFLVLPITLTMFMSSALDMKFRNPIITEVSNVYITDNDNSTLSKSLNKFLDSDLSNLFDVISSKEDASLEIVIPKGYEDSIINNKNIVIDINPLESSSIDILMKNILDSYHEQLYLSTINSDINLNELFAKNSLTTSFIEPIHNQSSKEYFAVSILGYLIILFIMNNVNVTYLGDTNGFNKRFHSMPIKRTTLLMYDFVILFVYSFVVLLLYIFANRLLNIAFLNHFYALIFICVVLSVFMSCACNFISVFLPKKIGLPLLYILMIIEVIFGGAFFPIENVFLQKISPLYFVTNLFNNYNSINIDDSSLLICLSVSVLLFLASFLKEKYSWREF